MKRVFVAGVTLVLVCAGHVRTHAFCGFYVSGSNKKMFNDATNVVLMRSGTRTVLAMQNDYRGPLEDFAMVVPVPVVLKPTDVKVVPPSAFDKIDALSSPRLVEYWEQDPCSNWFDDSNVYGGLLGDGKSGTGTGWGAIGTGRYGTIGVGAGRIERPAIAPNLASFAVQPAAVTAGVSTNLTFELSFTTPPWPEPRCTVDHGIGAVRSGSVKTVKLDDSATLTLVCENAAGKSTKQVRVSAIKIEAQFDIEEYRIAILSAKEAAGLGDWLRINGYKIPDGAEPLLRPYVEAGSKFFVAKVDPKKVKMVGGRVALSPLRFHYDSDEFSLPIRLGMANSSGVQDLIVNIISPDKRYEVANYKNATIPTNVDVTSAARDRFSEFYAALFDKTLEANPGAVITEYAWTSPPGSGQKCDPCPPELPTDKDLVELGADVIGGSVAQGGMVLTRLHARYRAADMKDDLRFVAAAPIVGGREHLDGKALERGARPSSTNHFQARYAVRHAWTGRMPCPYVQRNRWGGPPDGSSKVLAARKTAFAPRGALQLEGVIASDLPEIKVKRAAPPSSAPPSKAAPPPTPSAGWWLGLGVLTGLGLLGYRYGRRPRRPCP